MLFSPTQATMTRPWALRKVSRPPAACSVTHCFPHGSASEESPRGPERHLPGLRHAQSESCKVAWVNTEVTCITMNLPGMTIPQSLNGVGSVQEWCIGIF